MVSAHMSYAATDHELRVSMTNLKNLVAFLHQQGFKRVTVAGDFNTDGQRIGEVAGDMLLDSGSRLTIHTSKNAAPNSCGSNDGHMTSKNIDVSH